LDKSSTFRISNLVFLFQYRSTLASRDNQPPNPIETLFVLLDGLSDSPSLDMRDIDTFVTLMLDTDTRSTQQWAMPPPGGVLRAWHALDPQLPLCV
jgi:hypothetical protein